MPDPSRGPVRGETLQHSASIVKTSPSVRKAAWLYQHEEISLGRLCEVILACGVHGRDTPANLPEPVEAPWVHDNEEA